ncbi:unnamed protein product [Fraxinus pennsylvanica]|uniref:Pentatricopeptide repeat-containing protein n=1 Tax=Fraxinus pennsylvanica TaxID=56036 RepID=A0AAD1Z9Q8_9LAMI|nr:unnamed protein product [Fraxinus pennsylvanica]
MSRGSREVERRLLRLLHGRETRTHLTEIHGHLLRQQLHHSNQLLSHFISICSSLNKMPYAQRIFLQSANPNIFLFNSMIKGYSLCGPSENSFSMFSVMKKRGIWPDEFTFAPLLKACANIGDLKLGRGVHKEVLVLGFARFGSIRIGIVEFYVNCISALKNNVIYLGLFGHDQREQSNLAILNFSDSGSQHTSVPLCCQDGSKVNDRTVGPGGVSLDVLHPQVRNVIGVRSASKITSLEPFLSHINGLQIDPFFPQTDRS